MISQTTIRNKDITFEVTNIIKDCNDIPQKNDKSRFVGIDCFKINYL